MRQPDYRTLPIERLEEMVRDPRLTAEQKGPVRDELIRRFMSQPAPPAPAPAPAPPPPVTPRQTPAPPAPPRPRSKGSSAIGWVLVGVILTIVGLVAAVAIAVNSAGGGGDGTEYATTCDLGGGAWCPLAAGVPVGSPCYCPDPATGQRYNGVAR